MHVYYDDGPPVVTVGEAGTFEKGVSRAIDDKLAGQLLKKTSIVFKEGEKSIPTETTPTPGAKKVKEVANGGN